MSVLSVKRSRGAVLSTFWVIVSVSKAPEQNMEHKKYVTTYTGLPDVLLEISLLSFAFLYFLVFYKTETFL